MKKIFVSIKEFEKNGGVLVAGRPVYIQTGQTKSGYLKAGVYETLEPVTQTHIVGTGDRNFPISENTFYVEIEAQPIYK
jgi:hypothetical protein